jgi:hypothetical protein
MKTIALVTKLFLAAAETAADRNKTKVSPLRPGIQKKKIVIH